VAATGQELAAALAGIVGAGNVLADEAARRLASSDLFEWPGQAVAELVVRPGSTAETAAVARLLAAAGQAMVPRGAGLSYTAGAVPQAPAVVIDATRLDAIDIRADDLVAVVGAGLAWEKLAEALRPHGLKAAQVNPISGAVTTVGATAAQNIPGGSDGIIGLAAVLADGSEVRTGALAREGGHPFWRYDGPDLTGLFLGDCGAFGVKTEVALRLVPERPAAFASFAFETADAVLEAMVALMQRGLVARALAMDPLKNRTATRVEVGEAVRTVGAVVARSGSIGQAIRDVAQMARGRSALAEAPWSLHLTAEASTEAGAAAQLDLARALCRAGREIEPVVPKALRAKPYSIRGFVGPDGERWVPVHGVLPLSRARACMAALQDHLAAAEAALAADGISGSFLLSSLGAYMTIEPMFYWPDALDPIHMANLSERNRARFGGRPVNSAARETVRRMRGELTAILDAHGAVHSQIGRFYRFGEALAPGTRALLEGLKRLLDPAGRMNPGALGL